MNGNKKNQFSHIDHLGSHVACLIVCLIVLNAFFNNYGHIKAVLLGQVLRAATQG